MSDFFVDYGDLPDERSVAPSSLSDVIGTSFEATKENYLSNSKLRVQRQALEDRENQITEITGIPIGQILVGVDADNIIERNRKLDEFVRQRREFEPDLYGELKTTEEALIDAGQTAIESQQEMADAMQGVNNPFATPASFVGALGSQAYDPINYFALALGAPASAGVVRFALTEAAINAGLEAAIQPSIMEWQQEIGNEYGLSDALAGVGLAAVFGGAFAGTIKAGAKVIATPMSEVYRRMADSRMLPKNVRDAALQASRFEHVAENRPLRQGIDKTAHTMNTQSVMRAFASGQRGVDVPLTVSRADQSTADITTAYIDDSLKVDQLSQATLVKGDGVKTSVSLGDISGGTPQKPIPLRSIDNVADKVQENTKLIKTEIKKLKRLNQRLAKVDETGVDPQRPKRPATNQDELNHLRLDLQSKIEAQEEKIIAIDDANKQMEQVLRDRSSGVEVDGRGEYTMASRVMDNPLEGGPAFKNDEFLDDDFSAVDVFQREIEAMDSPEVDAALDADFARALDEGGNFKYYDEDGGELSVSDIRADIERNERVLESLTTCARPT